MLDRVSNLSGNDGSGNGVPSIQILGHLLAVLEEEDEVDADTDAGQENDSNERAIEDPSDGNSEKRNHETNDEGEDASSDGDDAAEEIAN